MNSEQQQCAGTGLPPKRITRPSESEPWQAGGRIGRTGRGTCPTCGRDIGLNGAGGLMPHVERTRAQ